MIMRSCNNTSVSDNVDEIQKCSNREKFKAGLVYMHELSMWGLIFGTKLLFSKSFCHKPTIGVEIKRHLVFRKLLINKLIGWFVSLLVAVAHICPPITGQRQTLNIGRSAYFSLQWLLRGWRNPHLLKSF